MAPRPKPTFTGSVPGRQTRIYIADGSLKRIGVYLRPERRGLPIAVVIDRAVDDLVGRDVRRSLTLAGWLPHCTVLSAGERIKSARTVDLLQQRWFVARLDRSTPVLAVGGGTITDSAGFAAATFMRGVPLWFVPTTVIGQVDAAIGGKVGINTTYGKNLIGCFYQPTGVIIDPTLLATLPARERRSGLAEIVKYGIMGDSILFRRCEKTLSHWVEGSQPMGIDVIRRCVRLKLRLVAEDEQDHGPRRFLNLGHTLGHALEKTGRYQRLRHGEAVALGIIGAADISRRRGWIGNDDFRRIVRCCSLIAPRRIGNFTISDIMKPLRLDKKRHAGRAIWVLPRSVGSVRLVDDVADEEVRAALIFLRRASDWAVAAREDE
ncbi:MAG: 3-dehydroquinate synthase [Candidatus Zixiibacteriota bacterium]